MGNSGNYRGDNDDTQLKGATDATLIGNVGDRLKVDADVSRPDDEIIDFREIIIMLKHIFKQLQIANLHLSNLSDYEIDEGDEQE